MLKKEHEVGMLGAPPTSVPMLPTVTNARSEAAVPDRIVCPCSVNPCCWASWHSPTPGRDQKMLGDVTGVQGYEPTATRLSIWALVLGLFLTIAFIICHYTGSLIVF